jgi:hypothetical protein
MEWEEFQKIREFINRKSLALMKHEGKDSATTGVVLDNHLKYIINGRTFYSVETNVFKGLVEGIYLQAHQKFPEKFGTNNANDVLEALYSIRPIFDLQRYTEFLRYEQFTYLFELVNGEVSEKVLRLDLFRQLNTNENGDPEFTGGLMHALKHFSVNGTNLSTGKDIHNINGPLFVIELILKAFFLNEGKFETPKKLVSKIAIDDRYDLKFVFYLEEITNVFFVKTIFKETKV